MLRSILLIVVGLTTLTLAGCTANIAAAQPRASTLPSVSTLASPPNSPSPSPEPAPSSTETTLSTSLSPVDAAERALAVFQAFRFSVTSYQAGGPPGTSGDYFVQHADSVSADQRIVAVECDWVSEGVTTVHFRSNLPLAQYKFVLKRVSEELDRKPDEPNQNLFHTPQQ